MYPAVMMEPWGDARNRNWSAGVEDDCPAAVEAELSSASDGVLWCCVDGSLEGPASGRSARKKGKNDVSLNSSPGDTVTVTQFRFAGR